VACADRIRADGSGWESDCRAGDGPSFYGIAGIIYIVPSQSVYREDTISFLSGDAGFVEIATR